MNTLCKYKDIFGKPNTGLHKYRIFNIAIIDVVATLILAKIIQYTVNNTSISYSSYILILLVLSVIVHKLFCVDTTLTRLFFI